jgi:hypothetical protein
MHRLSENIRLCPIVKPRKNVTIYEFLPHPRVHHAIGPCFYFLVGRWG